MTALSDDRLDRALDALGETRAPPPLGDALEAELRDLAPIRPRSPVRGAAIASAVSLVYALGLVGLLSLRADLAELPRLWVALWGGAWLAAFVGAGWLAVVPHPGRMMPDWRAAGIAAAMASAGFVVLGLTFDRHVPGVSKLVEPGLMALARNAVGCMAVGLITAIVPVVLGAILVRGAIPVRARWVGAGLGAAGGCLGGFALHLHCHIADKLHVGLAHGGVVALAAVLGALVIPRAAR